MSSINLNPVTEKFINSFVSENFLKLKNTFDKNSLYLNKKQ